MDERNFITTFESSLMLDKAVCASLADGAPLGVAVSGGADSIALLTALVHRFGEAGLRVITVNHNIRAEAETAGDAAFVSDYCAALHVHCCIVELERGRVEQTATLRGRGIEEAARFLRYEAFERFVAAERLCALALAHNQNDQLETLVMRFLQGSASGAGIACRRGVFIRPLLAVPRADIERYLTLQGLCWRTDATNSDTQYLRNRIRHTLLPALDAACPGWRGAALRGAEKAAEDDRALQELAASVCWKQEDGSGCSLGTDEFYALPKAVRRRVLYKALTVFDASGRFPYGAVRLVCDDAFASGGMVSAHGIVCQVKKTRLFVKKQQNKATESGFLGILEKAGDVCTLDDVSYAVTADGVLIKRSARSDTEEALAVCRVQLPVCIRSVQSADVLVSADGTNRSVSGLLAGWHIAEHERSLVPCVQELQSAGQPVVAVLGSHFAAPDWIDNEKKV